MGLSGVGVQLPMVCRYRVTPLIKNRAPLGPYSRTISRAMHCRVLGGGLFLIREVPL